jgi:putative aldouronate transport system permease protein
MSGPGRLPARGTLRQRFIGYMKQNWIFYLFILPAFLDVLIFRYFPMYGVQIAFRNYKVKKGIWGSEWVGLKYFMQFVQSPNFLQIMRNTLLLSFYNLLFGFPIPILLAFMINEIRHPRLKKVTQMITYMPHFISLVAIVGLINLMLDRSHGIVNLAIGLVGGEAVNFLGMSGAYRTIYIVSEIWQQAGWNTIIYLSALSTVDMESLDAARVDGASRLQKIRYIDFPTILPTIVILLILRAGQVLNIGFEKVYLLQNDLNRDVSEVISTYTYRLGILNGQFSYTTAIGLFNNVINAVILVLVNQVSRTVGETSLW